MYLLPFPGFDRTLGQSQESSNANGVGQFANAFSVAWMYLLPFPGFDRTLGQSQETSSNANGVG